MNRQQQQQQSQQTQQSQQQVVQQTSYQTQQQTQQVVQQQQRISRVEQHVTRQVTSQQQVQGMVMQSPGMQMIGGGRPGDASPPVFEQIFKNARFAQGGNALFEGRVRGNPKPVVSWTRKGAPLFESNKYKMQYEEQTGNVSLLINQIGPGDEGEYTCSARNQYGEAICSVYIQPEGQPQLGGYQRQIEQSYESSEQRTSGGQTVQSYQQQRTEKTSYSNGHTLVQEDFKVDTFEYRLLREVEYRESVTRRYSHETDARLSTVVDRALGPAAAPQISQKPRNSKLSEGSDAVFSAKVPANPKPRLTWFKNGVRIVPSQKFQSNYSNQQATLKVTNAQTEDSGHYTLLAENPQGCVVSSAYLAIEPQAQESIYQQQSSISTQQEARVVEASEVDASKMLAPNFVRVCSDRDVTEGKMTRFDCRVTGRPYPEVAWYINGRQVSDDATHKILVNESGNHALMITNVSRADGGVVTCVARNKAGETSFQCNLSVIEKELVVAPKFVERFTTVTVNEGEPVVLNARAVGTPCPRITWQKDGIPISSSPDVQISVDGGASTLDIPRAKTSDAAWYQCTAQNVAGSTATRARLYVIGPDRSQQTEARRLHLPRPTRVIEPEPEPGPEVIYLRHVERAKPHHPAAEPDRQYPPPQFIVPLRDVSQAEGGRIHFEARIEPVGDPTMVVEWFLNGRLLAASSRATTIFRFGFIALDLLSIIVQDGGEYVCRATSSTGVAESRARLTVTARATIEQSSQHPDSLQQIQQLEDYSRYQRTESVEDVAAQRPEFIRPLHDLGELQEGRNAHFEAQLTPVSDPTMKVEWYKDGRPITASSRITSIFNFGYVSLNILHLRAEDSGVYTVRALNRWGEAISSSTVRVIARTTVTGDLGIPEQQRYIEKTEELEAYHQQAQQYKSYQPEQQESYAPPEFKTPIKDQLNIRENAFAHFEARLEPVGDPTLRVEWFKDGRPVEASSRITSFFNFGYVALTIKNVTTFDQGTYTCRAVNQLGEAVTSAQLTVQGRTDIIMESQHPGGLEKIQYLEDNSRYARMQQEESQVTQMPRFLGPLKGTTKIVEGQRAHFEARVEPMSDTTLKIEWYHNGKAIQHANRIQLYHDFGYVALDILSVRAEDSGTYTVVARNALGEAQQSASMVVETRSGIDTSSMHRGTFEKTRQMEDSKFVEPHYDIEEYSKSKPIFVQPLSDPKPVSEGKNIHLECRLEPMGDPTMRVEWFQNGRPVTVGSRFRTYYDFGYVALDIVKTTAMDSGEYTCRATNHLGSAHTSACVRIISRADIVTETMNESSLEQIQALEQRHQRQAQEEIIVAQPPQFTRPLHNLETIEGTNVHLECRLQPVGDPTMRVDWFVNGRPVRTGHRFRPAYDFDYVALDLLSVYPEDSGVYTCQARNQLGEAVTSCSVRVIAKKDLILETQHPGGLEKIQYLEDTSRYKKNEMADEIVNVRPRFITRPKNVEGLREGSHAHFECKLEPVTDPNLKVEWFKNGRPITVGHRFRPIHDFGYVALDIIDLIAEDTATYTCRAVNLVGSDETTCTLSCRGSAQIVTTTENEQGLQQIQYLEDRSRFQRHEQVDESTTQAPVFTTSLKPVNIKEGQRAHFECRLIPVSDATMKVEWFHNNQPLKSGSRFTETNNFGFVALDILYCYPEDQGTYTCRARNILGEAVTSTTLAVQSRQSIQRDTQHESALGRINQLESTRHQRTDVPDDAITQPPVFTQPMRDVRVAENQAAHFEARLIPVGDPKLRVEWLRNGVPIQASNRVTTMHDFGYVALNMKYVNPEDSGTYTCRAINELGQAFTSAGLDVASKASLLLETQHHGAVEKIQQLEDHTRYGRREEQDVVVTQAPHFTAQLNGPTQLVEGQSAHYECRIEPYPDPNLKVEWFHNGKPLSTGHRYRTTYDFGFASLDVLTVYAEDAGEYTCRATNNLGQATSSIQLGVTSRASIIRESQHEGALQKIQHLEDDSRYRRKVDEDAVVMEKPQFGRSLRNIENLPEGQSAHLEATLTPVNDPTMVVEWFCNGRPIKQGHRFKTTYDFGFVALDVLYAYPEDSGTYMCRARNAVGEAVTTCAVKVLGKEGLCLDTLDEDRLKKIRELENYARPQREEIEAVVQKPVFVTPLASLPNLKEGEHAHLETRVEPINDPNLRIEWFHNGKPLKAGHRFRTTHDFGYVALDILYAYAEDSGTYMCKATNLQGEAVNTCEIGCASRRSIYLESQHPDGLEKIQMLEAAGHPTRLEVEEPTVTAPRLVTELRGTTEICEGQTAHFECQVEPMHDPNLRIDFYHNGKPLPSGNRFHITFDFGYVALDITHAVAEDAGEYSVRVTNALGECQSSIKLKVVSKGSIILESQRPEALEKISKLEAGAPKKAEAEEPQTRQRPVFTQPLQNIDNIAEGQTAHFECRLIPVGDPTLKVEWFRNEKPLETSSRIAKTHDFGFVSLDMSHVREEDEGVYMCRASNALGEAVTTASMKIRSKASIQLDTLHPEGMKRVQQLEEGKGPQRPDEPEHVFEKPIFTQMLTGPSELWEGQHAHFECRVVPVGDPNLRFEWFVNGVELKMGSRFRVTHDFGFVTLDISKTIPEDSGVYMCKAINLAGEAVSSTSLKVKSKSSIARDALQPDAWQKIQLKEAEMNKVPDMFVDTTPQQAPVFTTHLSSQDKLIEGQHVYLEAQVEPRADPNLRVEWFKNGESLTTGSRIRSTFDFGLVTLSINGLRADDSAIYTCKATNLLGEAVSTATLKIDDQHWLINQPLHPEAIPRIEQLEAPKEARPDAPEPTYELPVFITHLNNVECKEGDTVHFECHVEPAKDPTLGIEWFVNGKPLTHGARFKSTYDFGYVSLDISGAYPEDSGIYTCKATNSKGSATTSGSLRCTGKSSIYLDTQHPQGKQGLDAVDEVEAAVQGKTSRQPDKPEPQFPKPLWTVPLNPEFRLGENDKLHLEGTVEPKNDPNLKIEWYFNGKALEHGSRFKMTHDFGFVTLDLADVYERDQGVYTCKAFNQAGEAFTSTTIYCTSKENLIEGTQHPKGEKGLEQIQNLEDALTRQPGATPEADGGQPPVFTSQFQNLSNLSEGDIAHFEASLTPVGDQTMVVEWFYNGKQLEASHRTRTVHAFGMVVLEILGTKIEDSGTYTCRATNKWGQAEISVNLECVDKSKGQKPQFTSQIQSLDGLKEGDSAHFECTLIPVNDPNLKVEWFHNGQPLRHSSRIKSVSDFGFVVMDIAYVQSHDTGEYICKASNRYGEDTTRATIKCTGKGGVYLDSLQPDALARIRELESSQSQQPSQSAAPADQPPKFITQISDVVHLKEGQSAHFEARLTPVNDPNLVVEWYYNGKKLPHGHRYRTFHDFGIVILDILYCYEENSGLYECRAYNKVGEDSTKANLKCVSKANLILESQLPQGMEGGLEKIQTLEDSLVRTRDEHTTDLKGVAPVFTVPLANIDNLREGESCHFEARLTPTNDPKLKVEWFWNGKPLKTGSRFRTFCDFGFVILEISPVYPEDSGEYSCRAHNDYGEAVTTASMKIQGKRSIIMESQLPQGMEGTIDRIAELEGLGQPRGPTEVEDDTGKPPEFVTSPTDQSLPENSLAHFECRLIPVNDPSMRVEWFHNGKALWAGSRIKTINDFGFVILEVAGIYVRDAGLYTCKATNKHGEATVSCKLQVRGRQGIVLEPQLPAHFKTGTESIQKLEEQLYKKDEIMVDDEKPNPPRFIVELKDQLDLEEGQPAHFDCRVEPASDPTMRIDWFWNGRPFATGSRVHQLNDFGFIVMDLAHTYARDSGEFMCRATNKWGTATTKATLQARSRKMIDFDSQLPQGMSGEKLKALERGPLPTAAPPEELEAQPPKFITQIESRIVEESESVHFECRVEPKNDPKLRIEWYRNGKPLPSGHRYRSTYDMGFVSLDILSVYNEDEGEYVCRAVNDVGEDFTKATISCKKLPTIVLHNQVPKGMLKSEQLMQMEAAIKKYTSEIHLTEDDLFDPDRKQPPRFVTQIQTQLDLVEMQNTKFECQLAPVGDPNMKVEWFFNGKPLPYKNRFTPIYDFGYVAMNFGWVYPEDSGEYLCRATNLYGMDETRAVIKTAGKPGIIYESQLPKGMKSIERIREMEAAWQVVPESMEEEDKARAAPVFVTKPDPFTVEEGECARFCCRVTGHPRPRVMWLVNGHTVVNGSRYKLTYDGMWHLDIPKTRQYDNGTVEVIARNSVGEARVSTQLEVKPRGDDYRSVLKNSPRRILGTKEYRKPEWVTQMEELKDALKAVQAVPSIEVELRDTYVEELDTVVFECVYSGTPKPDIIWYHDDQIVRNTEKVKISIQESKTTCTVKYTNLEDAGIYVCKATSDIGMAITKAKLSVNELDEERKADKIIQIAQEEEEKIKMEKVKLDKKREKKKRTPRWGLTEGRDHISVEEVQVVESTDTFVETVDTATAHRRQSIQDSVSTSAIASCKKVDEPKPSEKPEGRAQSVLPEREGVSVSEAIPDHTAKEILLDKKPKQRKAKLSESEQLEEAKVTIVKVEEIIRTQKVKMAKEVEDIMELMNAREFGPGESPLRELAQIGFLVRHGVSVRDIESVYHETDQFPALRTPAAQSALVSLVEREGHGTLISQVLTEETTADETTVAKTVGFRAFMRMIELRHVTVEEVLTHFSPQDFQMPVWETTEASKVETTHLSTVKVTQRTKVLTDQKEIVKKRTTRHEDEIEGDVPFQSVDEKRDVLKPLEETSQEISSEEVQPFESDAIDKEVAEEATTPLHQKGKLDEVDVLQKPEKKPKKKKQVAPKELEDRPDVKMNGEKLEKVKLLPVKLERREIKPQKVVVTEPEKPQFASIKLKKAPISKKDQPKRVSFSVPRLKSRIRFVDFPPENQREQKPIVTYLGSVLDQGILSRNAREALKVLKLKPIKVKLPEDLERPVLEKVQFDKEDIQEVQKAKLDDTWTSEPKETKPEEQPQPQKLKLGKGKIPVEENLQEKVSLKKIPSKPSDEEPSENIPQKQVEQKPLTKPDIPSDEEVTLGKIEGFPPSSSDYEEDILKPEESQVSLDEHTDDQPKARKPKKKVVKTPEFEESILKKGIPKPTLPEETDDITLKKKQGELPVEEPEEIHLKPWVKEKPGIEKEPEGLNVGTPKPFDVEHPEADITPQEFETNDKEKPKKKRVVKKKSLQTPLNEELTQPDFETTEDLPETYPQEEAPTLVETPLVTNKPYVESEIVTQTMPQKSVKLDEPKEDKTAETNEDIVQEELTKKIEDEAETVTDVEPNQENIVKDQPTAEKKKKRKKSVPVESPEEPKPQEKSEDIPKISEIPEDKPEESKLEPEQKPEIEETPTEEASPKKKIVKKKKKVPKPDDQPEIVLDVDLDEEIERPVLEKYEPTPFVPKKKQIDQEKKEKLKGFEKQTIVRTEGAPKKVQVVPVDEVPQLATIKLKKATPVKRDDRRSVSLPKFLLKSRITRVPFPPDALIPVITNIGAKRDAGELSRNAEEAIKVLKKKRKKVKLPEDEERPELEEYTPFEDEERPEKPAEDTEPKPRVEKPKQPESEVLEPIKIEPKKGVVPETVEQPEEVKLRKVPEKVVETDTPTEKKPKKKSKDEVTPKPAREDETVDLKPFEPYDIPQEDIELEQPEKMPYEKPEKEKSPETKPKRTKPEKKKPEPEVIESVLVPGVPKPKPDDEPEDIKLRIKQGPVPDETPSEITLKPLSKPAVEAEDKPEEYLTLPKPAKPVTPEPEDNESVQIIVKKKKPKPSVVDEVAEAVTIKKAPIEESKDIKEEPEESLTLEKIPKPQMDEAPDVLSIVKMQPEVLEQEEDLTPAVTVERKKSKPSVVDEAVTLKKLEPEKPSDAEQVEEKIVVKKKKPKQPVVDEIPEALTIQKAEPEKSTDDVEVEQKVIVTKKEPKRPDVDESSEAVSIKKVEPVQPKGEDVVEEKVVLKQKKPTQPDADEISESVTVKKVEPEKPKDDEVIEKVVVKKKKAKQPVPEEISEAVTIKKVEPEKPKEEEAPSVSLKVPKQPEQPTVEDAEEKVTIKKIIPEEPIPADETSQELILKKKPKVPTDEAVSEEVTIKKIVPELPAEDTQVTEEVTIKKKPKQVPKAEEVSEEITVKKPLIEEPEEVETVTFKPKTTKKKEEVEQEFKIQLQQYEEEEISMSGKVRLKKPKPMTFSEEAGAGTIQITQEIDDESGPIIEEVSDDEGLQPEKIREDFEVKLRRRPSEKRYSIQDIEEEIQVGFRKEKRESVVYEEESLAFKPKPKRRPSQPTEQTEDVSLSITKETEVLKEESEDVVLADGDLVYSICSYVAENEDAMNLVEGERVYILESHNSDWWFVRKTLTAEKGWVPAKILKDEVSYTHHLTHTLHEKIDKLPVFEKPAPGETASAPRFVEKLQPQHAPDGATVQLECRVEGNPKPQITWFRETAIIKPSADFQMYYDEDNVATLIIREVFPEDAGFFTCVAKNNVGFASSTAELHVEAPLSDHGSDITAPSRKSMSRESSLADILEGIPPTFSRKPKAKCVPVGEDVDLECRLVAIPEPEVTWFFNGKEITTEKNVTVSMDSDMHSYSSVVRISKITRTQEGTYTVVAKNREGEASMTITVKVQTGEKEAPQILEPLRSVTIREGDSAVLSTQIVGNPKPKVSWHKDGKAAPKLPTKADGDTYTLTLIQPKVSDSAQYTVKAANEVGKCETSATLTVEEMPRPEPPLFVERFQELKVKEKSTIKLVAKVTGNPTPQITWFKDNEPLQPSPRVKETFDGSVVTLQVSGADSELDSGDYKCLASNPSGKASHGARVTVDVDKVTFTRKLQKSITVDEHDSIKLECETSHTVSTKWYHNGKELSGMDHREIVQENRVHRLVIKRTKALDAGTYACKVKDQSTECSVSVRETKAEFVRKVEDIEVTEREVAVLEVEVSSDTAEVTWHKDGEQLKEAKDKVVFEKKGGVRRLLIRSTSVHDEGEYTCSLGEQECTAEVTVIELPPEIITKLKDTTVAKGDRATFEIELTKGDALVKWFKDGKELQFSEHVQLAIDGKRQKLKIYNAELSDAGVFSCQVRDQTSSATLTVTAVPIIEVPKNEYKVKKGNDVTLEVKFVSTPPPTDEWSVNGTVIKKSKKAIPTLSESSASLTIKKVEETDVGNYNIKLKNPSGEASAELTLILIEPPGAPGTPDVLEVTNDTITLHWKAPESDGNSPITEYILEYHARGEFTWSNACKDTRITETTHKITKLTTNAELTFRVLAVNEAGPGEPSPATRFIRIAKSGAAEAPVIMEPLKDSTVGLGQSATLQCVISGTPAPEIKWLKNGTVIKEKTMKYEDHVAKYTINQSTENSVGKYTCQAKNEAGSAETSCNLSVQDIPTVEIDETLLNQRLPVKEQWKVKASFTGYPKPEVSWSKNGKQITSDKTTVIHTDEMSSTIAIYSVLREDSAKYTIMVTNSAGSANKDVELKVVDKPGKPQGPMELKDIDSESVTITWKPPVDDGGLELSKYSIEKCETKRMVWTKVADVDKDVQLYCVQKLQEDSEYMFRVFAQNPVGLSEPLESPPVTPRSAFDKPSAPRGPFEISSMTETSFTLKWQPPESDGGSPILEYLLERREAGKKAWQKVGTTSGEVTFINVLGLKANTPYNFRVTASNLVGSGPPYAPEEPITAGKMITSPSAPTNLTVIDITSRSVTLQWGPPENLGGTDLTGYIVERQDAGSQKWVKMATLEPSCTQYCCENLKEKSEFTFRVLAENSVGLSPPASTDRIQLKTHATPPSPPTAPLEILAVGPYAVVIEWGTPESDGGSPLTGYTIAIRDTRKTMWMEVGRVKADVQKLNIKDLQENHEYLIRIFAVNEVGSSEPLESEEPFKVLKPSDLEAADYERAEATDKDTPSVSFSTETTTSWMRENNMDADIETYAKGSLLQKDEYFFKIWCYAKKLFK